MLKETAPQTIHWSDENIIDLIRKMRNDLIKDFLDDRYLLDYLTNNFRVKEIPRLKIEFIRSELKDLLIGPVNVQHYESLIRQIRETDSASISAGNESLFFREIEFILRKYIY